MDSTTTTADQRRNGIDVRHYRDALIGLEHELAQRDRSIEQQASDNLRLVTRINELERRLAEVTGRWREAEANSARLQAMLGDAMGRAERAEGEVRPARERETRLQSDETIAAQTQAPPEDPAAERDLLARELEAQRESCRHLESELRRQSNANAVLGRELTRLSKGGAGVRKPAVAMDRQAVTTALPDTASPRRTARVVVSLEGDHRIKYPVYKSTMIIGRAGDADIHVIGRFTSRHHARIVVLEDETAVIEDLGSLNGVRVNGRAVKRHSLQDGDLLDVGGARLQFVDFAERDATHRSA